MVVSENAATEIVRASDRAMIRDALIAVSQEVVMEAPLGDCFVAPACITLAF